MHIDFCLYQAGVNRFLWLNILLLLLLLLTSALMHHTFRDHRSQCQTFWILFDYVVIPVVPVQQTFAQEDGDKEGEDGDEYRCNIHCLLVTITTTTTTCNNVFVLK